jgi:hypothetical protein
MGTKTVKRAGGSKKKTPQFLLADNTNIEEPDAPEPIGAEAADEDWPEREDIRNGLVHQVSSRFGISQDVAIRAINDMLRLN